MSKVRIKLNKDNPRKHKQQPVGTWARAVKLLKAKGWVNSDTTRDNTYIVDVWRNNSGEHGKKEIRLLMCNLTFDGKQPNKREVAVLNPQDVSKAVYGQDNIFKPIQDGMTFAYARELLKSHGWFFQPNHSYAYTTFFRENWAKGHKVFHLFVLRNDTKTTINHIDPKKVYVANAKELLQKIKEPR